MGYAREHLSTDELAAIARDLFKVTSHDQNRHELIGLCPIHGEKNPSFAYNYQKDVFTCAGCQATGDLVTLWANCHGHHDQKAGFQAFIKAFDLDEDPHGSGSSPIPPKTKKPAQPQPPDPEPPPPSIIDEEIWEQMTPLPDAWVERLHKKRGWTAEAIRESDLRQQTVFLNPKSGKINKVKGKPDRIAIPIRDDDGKLVNIRLYKPGAKVRKIMSWGKGYGSARLYPAGATVDKTRPVIFTEGEADRLCGRSYGLQTFTQTSKRKSWPDDQKKHFRGCDVIIAYDADKAGQKYAEWAASSLADIAKRIRLIEWPEYMGRQADGTWPDDHGQDLTDFFIKHGKTIEDWNTLVQSARPWKNEEAPDPDPPPTVYDFYDLNEKTGRWTFRPRYLANKILEDIPLMYDPKTGLLYKWGGKYWEEFFEESVKKTCLEYLGDDSTTSRVNDATTQAVLLSTIAHGREVNDHEGLICIDNGMLDLATLELTPHDQDYYSTYKLDVEFNQVKDRFCRRWLDFLGETIQTEAAINQSQEFAGYCMTRETRFAKSLFLLGPGADGKSIYLKILRKMIGPSNCSAVSFSDMQDQFYRSAIYNKLLNISTEIGAGIVGSEYFKAIVTGDPIMAAFKNKTPFEFLPFCKLAFATNKLPRVSDNSDGFFRRVLPISFKRQFFGKDRDTRLEEKLTEELSEIFLWALAGLHRLWEQNDFTWCDETDELILGYKRLNNPVLSFIEDACELGDTEAHMAPKEDIYRRYRKYCRKNGYTQMNNANFFRELKTAVTSIKEHRPRVNGQRIRAIEGIKLTDPDPNECPYDDED